MRQSESEDPYNLGRFVAAQEPVFDRVCEELRRGRKESHWMWFVFPQLRGLGRSVLALRYAIASLAEAAAYLAHPVLGPRLRRCVALVNAVTSRSAGDIFGYPDDLKFHSSLTLFARSTADNADFAEALQKYFGGAFDPLTLDLLSRSEAGAVP
jgi:uncharacterized protein (DUF1810 family)